MLLDLAAEHAGLIQGITIWTIAALTYIHLRRRAA